MNIRFVTGLPAILSPSTVYLLKSGTTAVGKLEIHVSDNLGTSTLRIDTTSDINTAISNAVAMVKSAVVVANIAARDALPVPTSAQEVVVIDATGDATVLSGGAGYIYNVTTSSWIKTYEAESLDLVQSWSALQGIPLAVSGLAFDAVTGDLTFNDGVNPAVVVVNTAPAAW